MDDETVNVNLEYHIMAEGAADAVFKIAEMLRHLEDQQTSPIVVSIQSGKEFQRNKETTHQCRAWCNFCQAWRVDGPNELENSNEN
jgi:hypothetical protein